MLHSHEVSDGFAKSIYVCIVSIKVRFRVFFRERQVISPVKLIDANVSLGAVCPQVLENSLHSRCFKVPKANILSFFRAQSNQKAALGAAAAKAHFAP